EGAHPREAVAEAHEGVEAAVHARPERVLAVDEVAVVLGLRLRDGEGADPPQEALRPERVSRLRVARPIADLGHEAVVGAEAVREVLHLAQPVGVARAVVVPEVEAVPGERLARPLRGQLRAVGRVRLKSSWPVTVSRWLGRHWKSGPATRLYPPSNSRSVPSRLTTDRPTSRRSRPTATYERNSWSARLEPLGPGRITLPPPR